MWKIVSVSTALATLAVACFYPSREASVPFPPEDALNRAVRVLEAFDYNVLSVDRERLFVRGVRPTEEQGRQILWQVTVSVAPEVGESRVRLRLDSRATGWVEARDAGPDWRDRDWFRVNRVPPSLPIRMSVAVPAVVNLPEMLTKQVAAEVPVEVPPHRMDVVRVVLRVVVLDEESRALHPVVVGCAASQVAGPRKGDRVRAGSLEPRHPLSRDLVGHVGRVGSDELHEHRALWLREPLGRDPGRRQGGDVELRSGHDVPGRDVGDDGDGSLGVIERQDERAGRVFLQPERP